MELYYHEVDKDVLILDADGGLTAVTAAELITEIEKLIDAGLKKIVIDCSKLNYINTVGLGRLVGLHLRMKRRGGDVKVASVGGMVSQVLQATRLATLFDMYPDVNRARAAFRPAN